MEYKVVDDEEVIEDEEGICDDDVRFVMVAPNCERNLVVAPNPQRSSYYFHPRRVISSHESKKRSHTDRDRKAKRRRTGTASCCRCTIGRCRGCVCEGRCKGCKSPNFQQ